MTIKTDKPIHEMNGPEFSALMKTFKNSDNSKIRSMYKRIMEYYFDEYTGFKDPIVTSWENDFDEVWDAEAFVEEYLEEL